MDRNEGRIRLAIPTIDLLECRKFKGGYHEDGIYDTDNYYPEDDYTVEGGEIDPAVVVGNLDNENYDREDDFERDDNWDDDQSDYEQYEDYREEGDDTSGNGEDNNIGKGTVVVDDSVPKDIKDQIDSLLNSLPAAIANQDVKIISDPKLLDSISSEKGEKASGAFLHEGYVLPDGTKLSQDTILLGNGADISTVQEELVHCWQMNNCFEEGATTNNSMSAMEFQASVVEAINILESYDGIIELPTGISEDFAAFYYLLTSTENNDIEGGDEESELDIEGKMNEFYSYWIEFYNNLSEDHPYAQGNDEHYDWNWDDILADYINE